MAEDVSTVHDVVDGDFAKLGNLELWSRSRLEQVAHENTFVLRASTVAAVLKRLSAGQLDQTEVQKWASLMRWGGYSRLSSDELDVDFEPDRENCIGDAIARLDELGDLIDGEFRPGEIDELIAALTN